MSKDILLIIFYILFLASLFFVFPLSNIWKAEYRKNDKIDNIMLGTIWVLIFVSLSFIYSAGGQNV